MVLRQKRYTIETISRSQYIKHKKLELMLTNPRDAFRGQSPNTVPFDMLGMVSYWCAIDAPFFTYSTSKNVETLKSGPDITQGHRN